MAKNTHYYDGEIDLIELIQVFLTHKTKYIVLGIAGLTLGLVHTFQHEPRFETKIKVHVGHPAFNNLFLINSSGVQKLLNNAELNQNTLPRYQLNQKSNLFVVVTEAKAATEVISEEFNGAMRKELMQLKQVAASFEGFADKQNISNNNTIISWTNQDIAELNIEEVVQSLVISFSESKALYPKPFKHGSIGIFIGLVLAFGWMISVIMIRKLSRQKK